MKFNSQADSILYRLSFADGQSIELPLALHEEEVQRSPSEWSRLGYQQCAHCPLDPQQVRDCPFATALGRPVQLLAGYASYEPVEVQVLWRDRDLRMHTSYRIAHA